MAVKENEKYGKLTTLKVVGRTKHRQKIWECLCDCGNIINVSSASLTTKNTKSCGCLHSEALKKMGEASRKLNKYDLTGDYGIGYTSKDEPFYFDLEDYDKIKKYTWSLNPEGYVISIPFGKPIRMHMLVMDSNGEFEVDHIYHNVNDNRKQNLRICEHFENHINSKTYSNNTSGRKGVYWDKSREKWIASITYNKKIKHLGRFETFEEAVKAREEAEQLYHGEFIFKEESKKERN